jgi:hypothetical protein
MKEINCSTVNTKNTDKIAATGNQNKNPLKVAYSQEKNKQEQVVNARKGINLTLAKKKAKKKAKMKKASQKINKK